ncbi:MAG: class I SAM-dependent methyltransferase, partial [Methylotenera sp.]|nr:class I SAM-dependent methyltransferase [Methylotenera sp.]
MHIAQAIPANVLKLLTSKPKSDLPACIERVSRSFGATRHCNSSAARFNLNSDNAGVQHYMGTYMPRTIFEFMTVGNEMLAFAPIRKTLGAGRPLRILDIGSGTGGAWMGLATALFANGFRDGLEIDAVDGNPIALRKQQAFATAISEDAQCPIAVRTICRKLGPSANAFRADLSAVLSEVEGNYDFILVSKHLSELFCYVGAAAIGVVQHALNLLGNMLTPTGYVIVMDVTIRIEQMNEYFPQIFARELSQYLAQDAAVLQPVLPVPCAISAKSGCVGSTGACYTQRLMQLQHSMPMSAGVYVENTKVTYRVLARRSLAARVATNYSPDLAYHVNDSQSAQACHH